MNALRDSVTKLGLDNQEFSRSMIASINFLSSLDGWDEQTLQTLGNLRNLYH